MENKFEYLPMGTVVILKKGSKKLMIFGRKQLSLTDGKEYDYISYLYPEGNIKKDLAIMFNHEDIGEIVCRGYEDDDERRFRSLFLNTGEQCDENDVFSQR